MLISYTTKEKVMKKTFLLLVLLTLSVCLLGQVTEINLVSEAWEDGTNEDGTGFYWDLVRLVYESEGITVNTQTVPYERAVALVEMGQKDAWVGAYEDEEEFALFPKNHLDLDYVAAVYINSKISTWNGENSLKGKKLAWMRGYSYDSYLSFSVEFTELDKRDSAYKMLLANRIDLFIDAQMEIDNFLSTTDLDKTNLEVKPLMDLKLFLAFGNSDKSRELITIWDKRIDELKKSGELKKFYEKHGYSKYPF
jgi:polar amino acid transport system substrate-binding protein